MAKDPVCGMGVEEMEAAATVVHDGSTYYFCAQSCKERFGKNPGEFLAQD